MITSITVKLLDQNSVETSYIKIDDIKDLPIYFDMVREGVEDCVHKVIKSQVPIERWDHFSFNDHKDSIFNQAVAECQISGGNPLYKLEPAIQRKYINFVDVIQKYGAVCINSVGGFCGYDDDRMQLLFEEPFIFEEDKSSYYDVPVGTTHINLENDPDLESFVCEKLSDIDPTFSYITRLRKFSKDELVEIFQEFTEKGGESLYVYTTGSDVPQMYEYCEAAEEAGITDGVFIFNAGITDQIEKCMIDLEYRGWTLTWGNSDD